jgi:hypothetical protein
MDERKDFLGRGWAWPVRLDPGSGQVAMTEFEEDIRQAIRIIIETSPGERVMRPDFGCGIHDLVFEALDSATVARVRSVVQEALIRFEPRIEVVSVQVDPAFAAEGRLQIELEYRVRRTNQVGNLVYPFYFREGGRA